MIYKQEVLLYHQLSIEKYGGAIGIRDEGMLSSAIERPFASFGGEDLYKTPFEKAAAILESIIKNHPFVDGNKRVAFAAMDIFLRINGYRIDAGSKVIEAWMMECFATSSFDFESWTQWLKLNTKAV